MIPTMVYQLNSSHCTLPADADSGGTCGGDDCAVCCAMMGIDFASNGKVLVNQKQIRALQGVPDIGDGGLQLIEVRRAVLGFDKKFDNRGFEQPVVTVHQNGTWEHFVESCREPNKFVILFINNETWAQLCRTNGKHRLAGDLEYKGTHAVGVSHLKWDSETASSTSTIKMWNPLFDGRKDQPSGVRVAKGPQRVPLGWVKAAAEARAGKGVAEYVVVRRAKPIAIPEPDPDPCARPTEPQFSKTGKAGEGAK